MRYAKTVLIALAALGAIEFAGTGTPIASVQVAQAQALPSVWQTKAKKLAKQIHKSRQSLSTNAADIFSTQFKADQFAKRIANHGQSLAKIPAADDPNLNQAKEQFAALQSEFAAAQGGGSAAAAPTPEPAAPATPSQSTGSTATAAPAPAPASNVRQLVSGERVRVKKLTRDMGNVLGSISTEGPSLFQDPLEYNAAVKRFGQFTDALKKYPQADDPDVKAARDAYLKLRATLEPELARGKEQYEILGDVTGNLRALQNRDNEAPIPDSLTPPFDEADVKPWLAASLKAREVAKKDYKYIQDILPIVYLPEFTKSGRKAEFGRKDLPRLARMTENRYKAANNGYGITKRNISSALRTLGQQVETPTARTNKAELMRHRAALDEMIPVAESAVHLEKVLGKPTDEAEQVVADLHARRKAYEATREAAIDAVRLPEAVTDDAKMLAIAEEVLAKPRYKFGEHGPIILTMGKMSEHEKKESEIEIDKIESYGGDLRLSGTEETTIYKWTEFQFATVLKDDGSGLWRITYIKPKFYTSGGSTTPLNEWISGGVVEGELIREEHIGKR